MPDITPHEIIVNYFLDASVDLYAKWYSSDNKADDILDYLTRNGYMIITDEPNHYVTFDYDGWFVEHSIACRVAGTIGTCEFNQAVRKIADNFDPMDDEDLLGRWQITDIDSEGLPSLQRAPLDCLGDTQ